MTTTAASFVPPDGWSQVPAPPVPRRGGLLLRWAVTALPVAVALWHLDVEPWRTGTLVVGVLVGLLLDDLVAARLPGRRWVRPVVAAVVTGGVSVAVGPRTGLVALGAAVAWSCVLVALRHASAGTAWRGYRPAVGPLLVADVLLLTGGRVRLAAVLVGLAVLLCGLAWRVPAVMGRVAAAGDRAGGVLATVLAAVAAVPAAAVVVVMSGVYRLVGFDPLRSAGSGPRWRHRAADPRPAVGAAGRDTDGRLDRRGRRRRSLAGAVVGVVLLAGLVAVSTRPPSAPVSAAFPERTWPDRWAEQGSFNSRPRFDSTTVWRLDDFDGRWVNQRDGRRTTWRPPPCSCPRRRVWWFGGSAAWGFFQSDDETVPSQIARAAWADGVALDIENFAVPGYSLSQEMQRFAQLSVTERPPDLAVFYDGANELFVQEFRNNRGQGADESPGTYADQQLDRAMRTATWAERLWRRLAPGAGVAPPAPGPTLDAPDVAAHAMARYRRQVDLVQRVAAPSAVPVLFVWQPVRSTAPDAVAAEWAPMAPADAEWHRRLAAAARRGLPAGVLDLSDVFDDTTGPLLPDWAHSNGRGSTIVAGALVDEVVRRAVPAPRP